MGKASPRMGCGHGNLDEVMVSWVKFWGKGFPGGGNSKCKDLEVGCGHACLRKSQTILMVRWSE